MEGPHAGRHMVRLEAQYREQAVSAMAWTEERSMA